MTADQLKAARAVHWRQSQNPILTREDAQSWLEQHPLSLFLPRQAQLPAPAPSFVEACRGEADATPPHEVTEQARRLLVRLIASGSVVALNLFGSLGEQPDFIAQAEILPFVISLRGDRDWKQAPEKSGGHKISPLVLELWKILERDGPLTAAEAREKLGREITEAAVLRALSELWQSMRVVPALQTAGQPAQWELLQDHHRAALTTGSATSQVTAISLLVSMYLQSVYAATGEQIEIFLSPLVSRSRVREAVRGLSATRQIHSLSMDAQTYYFLEGGLPEFASQPEAQRPEPIRRRPEMRERRDKLPPELPRRIPAKIQPPMAARDAGQSRQQFRGAPKRRDARPFPPPGSGFAPARGKDRRPQTGEKPRWSNKQRGASGTGARPEPGGSWKRKAAAPGGTKERWRKFPQRPGTSDRPESRTARKGPTPGAPFSERPYQRSYRGDDQREGARKTSTAPDRKPGGQGFARPKRSTFPSRFPPKHGGPSNERAGQERPASVPGGGPSNRRPGPRGGAPIRPSGKLPGFKPGGYKGGISKPGSATPRNARPAGPKPRGFKARDSGSRPFRPRFGNSVRNPQSGKGMGKRSFRDRNLGKKKPEA